MHRFKRRKQVCASESAIEVLPAKGIERPNPRVVIYDRDVVHAREQREVLERFHPKFHVRLVGLRADGQGG